MTPLHNPTICSTLPTRTTIPYPTPPHPHYHTLTYALSYPTLHNPTLYPTLPTCTTTPYPTHPTGPLNQTVIYSYPTAETVSYPGLSLEFHLLDGLTTKAEGFLRVIISKHQN